MTQRGSRATASRRQERLGERWEGSAQEVFLGLREWRALHPTATLDEIETELDRRLAAMRAQILTDLALASRAAELQAEERPCCPTCGGRLQDEGKHTRRLMTLGNETVLLERDYAICPACVSRFFPPGPGTGLAAQPSAHPTAGSGGHATGPTGGLC